MHIPLIVYLSCIWVRFGNYSSFFLNPSRRMKALDVALRVCVFLNAFFARLRRVCLKAFSHHLLLIYTWCVCVCFLQLRGNTRDVLFRCIYAARVSSALFAYFVNIGGAATSNAPSAQHRFPKLKKPICMQAHIVCTDMELCAWFSIFFWCACIQALC